MITESASVVEHEKSWYALYTRPKFERRVVSSLQEKQIHSFLPTRSVVKFWSDRKKTVNEPLFPSYVFVLADMTERYRSLQSHGVIRMVHFNGKPARIPRGQIENINRLLENGCNIEPYHQYLRMGDEVEITYGPLRGLKGYFVENRGKNRLVISVHAIQQSLIVEVNPGQIKRAGVSLAISDTN